MNICDALLMPRKRLLPKLLEQRCRLVRANVVLLVGPSELIHDERLALDESAVVIERLLPIGTLLQRLDGLLERFLWEKLVFLIVLRRDLADKGLARADELADKVRPRAI